LNESKEATEVRSPVQAETRNGVRLLPARKGLKVTLEDIQRIQQEIDDEDARRAYFLNDMPE
jgi:hypothetical protein